MIDNETKKAVFKIFDEYLEKNGHRKTPERYAILDEVYSHDGHFDVESMYISMKNKKYEVSRATLYNTMDILQDCNLVIRHQFRKNIAQFEKAHQFKQHDHLICTVCGKVIEFCDPRINEILTATSESKKFEVSNHSLYIYGVCKNCQK